MFGTSIVWHERILFQWRDMEDASPYRQSFVQQFTVRNDQSVLHFLHSDPSADMHAYLMKVLLYITTWLRLRNGQTGMRHMYQSFGIAIYS